MAVAEVFRALGDPVRLEMVRRIGVGAPATISAISGELGMTRQGARKHLQVLVDAGIVRLVHKGRDVVVQAVPSSMAEASTFISEIERQWDARLEALKRFVEENP